MRREIVLVAIIGILFGLIIAFGAWRINSSLSKPKQDDIQSTPNPQNSITEFKISLNTPENDSVEVSTPIPVSGITKPLTPIVISGESGDYILQTNDKGVFNQEVDLIPGINQIKVTAIDPSGGQSLQKVLIVYSSAFQLKNATLSTPDASATGEAAIQAKVAQKVSNAMNQPKAYLGVVTDITNSTIQIKNPDSQIEQISVGTEGITVVDTKGTNNKQVKLSDVAIGDFIVAMGYVNGNLVLGAQRILITDPLTDLQISVSLAKVTAVTKKTLTVTDNKSGSGVTLTPDKNTSFASFTGGKTSAIKISNLNVDDQIIYVNDTSGTPALLRSIFDKGKP